jgi:hypothetical protein
MHRGNGKEETYNAGRKGPEGNGDATMGARLRAGQVGEMECWVSKYRGVRRGVTCGVWNGVCC